MLSWERIPRGRRRHVPEPRAPVEWQSLDKHGVAMVAKLDSGVDASHQARNKNASPDAFGKGPGLPRTQPFRYLAGHLLPQTERPAFESPDMCFRERSVPSVLVEETNDEVQHQGLSRGQYFAECACLWIILDKLAKFVVQE